MGQSWLDYSNLGKRSLWALPIVLLTSCATSGLCWKGGGVVGSAPAFGSARIILAPANEYSGLELEFVQSVEGLRLYLNVYGLEIPPEAEDSDSSRVYISFREHSYAFSARRFVGGQRLLIPPHVRDEIITYLQDDQPVFIQVGRYKADIYPDKFIELFKRLIRANPQSLCS